MKIKYLFLILPAIGISFCTKKCHDAEDAARTKPKDPALMYIWRFTNNLIITKGVAEIDSGYFSFKPNGDYNTATQLNRIDMLSRVWYSNNNTFSITYCSESVPGEISPLYKYQIKNDTLFLYVYYDSKTVATIPKTLIHVKKY